MKKKTKILIARIIVVIMTLLLVLSAVLPYVFGETKYVTYSNKKLHMEFKIPKKAKADMDKISENAREFPIDFYLTARVIYGDIYEEILSQNKLSEKDLDRSEIYIKSKYVKDTWDNREYVSKYFKSILGDAKSSYSYDLKKTTLSGIPAWECHYKGKQTQSAGYYYLTLTNGGLHVLQLDCYLKSISNYKKTVEKIKDSYKITDLVIPGQNNEKKDDSKKKPATGTEPEKQNQQPEKKVDIHISKPAKIILIAVVVLCIAGIVFLIIRRLINNGTIDRYLEERKRNRKLKVTRKNNSDID